MAVSPSITSSPTLMPHSIMEPVSIVGDKAGKGTISWLGYDEVVAAGAAAAGAAAAAGGGTTGAAAAAEASPTLKSLKAATSASSSTITHTISPTLMSFDPSGKRIAAMYPSTPTASKATTALSVSTSHNTSPSSNESPTLTSHDLIVPTSIVGERAGSTTTSCAGRRVLDVTDIVRIQF